MKSTNEILQGMKRKLDSEPIDADKLWIKNMNEFEAGQVVEYLF